MSPVTTMMMKVNMATKRLLGVAVLVLVLVAASRTPGAGAWSGPAQDTVSPNFTGCGGVTGVPSSNAAYEQEVVERVNAIRWDNGHLPPLKRVSLLDDAARYHATDMGQDNYFSHTSYDRVGDTLVEKCNSWTRINTFYSGWSSIAENIAAGYTTPADVMTGWMNSTGHRANILRTTVWEIGVGYYQGSGYYYRYWVQDFGRRSNVYPVVIDREAASTDSSAVDLYVYGWDGATQMRFRNEDGDWSSWEPYNANRTWTLSCGAGTKTVSAQVTDGSTTYTASDTINLTTQSYVLDVSHDTVGFLYDLSTGQMIPGSSVDVVIDEPSGCSMTWTAAQSGDWFTASPLSGSTPMTLTINPDNFSYSPGQYTGTVTVEVTDPVAGVLGDPHTVEVSLSVIDQVYRTYLPLILSGH